MDSDFAKYATNLVKENFNKKSLNESVWNFELGDGCPNLCGYGNNERQIYTKKNPEFKDGNLVIVEGKGRHDPCVLPRAVPVV